MNKGNLKRLLVRFDNTNKLSCKDGLWSIAKGGYNLCWELYYDGVAKIQCIDGKIVVGNDEDINVNRALKTIKEVYGI